MKILLCSGSSFKEDVIKKWFMSKLELEPEIENINIINDLLPRQAIGEDIKLICLKKINDVKEKYSNDGLSYIISIENFLEILEDKIKYKFCMCVYKFKSNEYITEISDGVDLDIKILDKYSKFLLIIKDLRNSYINTSEKYIFKGCEDKLVEIIIKYYPNLQKNNCIKNFNNKYNNINQLEFLLDKVFM